MAFDIAPGVSFCRCQDRFIFLDLPRERYFALGRQANGSFGKLVEGGTLDPDDRRTLSGLVQQGLLIACADGTAPSPCRMPPIAKRSLIETDAPAGLTDVSWALARLAAASFAVKRRPLGRVLDRLARRKAKRGRCDALEDELAEVAAVFSRSAIVASPLDQCLPRSLAAAHLLLDRGYRSELVIGVRLQPFAAHCWLQSGHLLVNETIEEARNFTPICVI